MAEKKVGKEILEYTGIDIIIPVNPKSPAAINTSQAVLITEKKNLIIRRYQLMLNPFVN